MACYRFDHLYTAEGWLSPGFVAVEDGNITGISGDAPDAPVEEVG